MQPLADALACGPVVLDGGLATWLEATGHDLSGALWSARVLRDDPSAVVAAHLAFFAAGARVATTASYQVGAASGTLLGRSVRFAAQARERAGLIGKAWVAASVGPYGAMLADGSEYTGGYVGRLGVRGLGDWHRPRLELLAAAGPDVLACETVPALAEAEALTEQVRALGVPAWLSLTTVVGPDGVVRTRRGEPAREAFAAAAEVDAIVAVGVNCTDPGAAAASVALAARASGKPVVVYPNSGEHWDAVRRTWSGRPSPLDVAGWLSAGARLVGGCCRVGPAGVAQIARAVSAWEATGPAARPQR